MAIYNVFVKLLDGKTLTLKFSSPTISGESLKQDLYTKTQIPPPHQRLITGTHQISDKTLISLPKDGNFFTVHLLLRLLGGKGGFGSLLRGAATKAGQKKTNNFDACRDMSGRRLRHVNAEKKLEEWKADAEERRLEKVAEDFIKKKVIQVKKSGNGESEKYIAKYREDSRKCMEDIEASVRESFGRYEDSKRKMLPSSGSASKKLKMWVKEKADDSDSDDEDDEDDDEDKDGDEKSVVLDDFNHVVGNKDGEGSSRSISEAQSDGESSGGGSSLQSNLEEENGIANGGNFELGEGSGSGGVHAEANTNGSLEPELAVDVNMLSEIKAVHIGGSIPLDVESGICKETIGQSDGDSNPGVVGMVEGSQDSAIAAETNCSIEEVASGSMVDSSQEKPLNFDDYNSAAEVEVLGLERLKAELVACGLKCGGTLQERAARLFLLKTTPLERLPKKLFAKK